MCVAAVWNKSPGLEAVAHTASPNHPNMRKTKVSNGRNDSRTVEVTHVHECTVGPRNVASKSPSFFFKKEGRSNCIHFSTQKSPEYPLVQASCGSVDQGGSKSPRKFGGWHTIHTPDAVQTNASGAHLIASPARLPSLLALLHQSSQGWTADDGHDPNCPMAHTVTVAVKKI